MMTPATTPALRIEGVMSVLQCSRTHVQNLIHGRVPGVPALPHVRMGRMYLIRRESLERWLQAQETASLGDAA